MAGPSSGVRKQWDIGHSIFLAGAVVRSLIKAGSEDDIQPQAILAMEGLGAGLLVDQERISDGVDALKGGENRKFNQLMITAGLTNGGAARLMRDSIPCVAAFVLAVACKTCFTDQETGSILYEMMHFRGVLRSVPVSRTQIERAVGALSGYGHNIVPNTLFDDVASTITRNMTQSLEMPGLLSRSGAKEIAEVLSDRFESLQDTKIKKITLEGHQTGIWFVTMLVWLLPNDTQLILHNKILFGRGNFRLKIILKQRDDSAWYIQKWYSEERISELVGGFDNVPTKEHRSLPLSHVPVKSAKTYLAAAYRLPEDAVEATGLIVTALVNIVKPVPDSVKDICQMHFIERYHTITKVFGWNLDFDKVNERMSHIVAAYTHELSLTLAADNGMQPEILDGVFSYKMMSRLLLQLEASFFKSRGFAMIQENNLEHIGIIDPIIHVAAEALYCSIIKPFPCDRPFRPLTVATLHSNAESIWRLLSGDSPLQQRSHENVNQIACFRSEAVKSICPGALGFGSAVLAVVGNGHVAYATPLMEPSTERRYCAGISMIPGTLRWGEDHARYLILREVEAAEFASARRFYEASQRIEVFQEETYLGLEALPNSEMVKVETLISPSENTLTLTTYLDSPSLQDAPVAVNWWRSIEALAFAELIHGHDMSAFGERELARSWKARGFFDKIAWLAVGGLTNGNAIKHHITTTRL
ncbi:MAG: hypothetical protein Q9215_006218 [Flavoplaca cf. flavocitrina]